MILAVVLHAALAYNLVSIPNLIWVVQDPAAHRAFDVLCWWTLGISSPFYLMSGFFGVEVVRTRGLWAFMNNRAKRILGPFIVAGLTILPVTFFVWVGGWLISGRCTPREIARMKFHATGFQQNLYGPAHLQPDPDSSSPATRLAVSEGATTTKRPRGDASWCLA